MSLWKCLPSPGPSKSSWGRSFTAKCCVASISLISKEKASCWGAWVAQSVERPTSAQVIISWFVSSSPASGSVLTAGSLEPASDSVSPLSAPPLLVLCISLSKINKCKKKKKKKRKRIKRKRKSILQGKGDFRNSLEVGFLAVPFTHCVALDKILSLSEPVSSFSKMAVIPPLNRGWVPLELCFRPWPICWPRPSP